MIKMSFQIAPRKGWVLVEPIENEISESSFLIPDSTTEQSEYMMGRTGDSIIVFLRHMMIEIEYKNQVFNLLEEKYIVADIEEVKN